MFNSSKSAPESGHSVVVGIKSNALTKDSDCAMIRVEVKSHSLDNVTGIVLIQANTIRQRNFNYA